jgi:nuclear pore complex protein Nup98-Nup96
MVMQPALVKNPFGMLPATPQMSIGNGGSAPSVQYGISSLPVSIITVLTILIVKVECMST